MTEDHAEEKQKRRNGEGGSHDTNGKVLPDKEQRKE